VASATDQSEEHEAQYRIREGYAAIEAMHALRNDLIDKASRSRNAKAKCKQVSQADAIWLGMCALRDRMRDDISWSVRVGLLPVLWNDSPTNGHFWQ
jgi:hypothetical protein